MLFTPLVCELYCLELALALHMREEVLPSPGVVVYGIETVAVRAGHRLYHGCAREVAIVPYLKEPGGNH